METASAALVWPALILVFAAIFAGLWRADPLRKHLLGFAFGFLALFCAMSFHIAFASLNTAAATAAAHGLSSLSVIAIVWGACSRLSQRIPFVAMLAVSLVSSVILYAALANEKANIALLVQNGAIGLLFGIGTIVLWIARPSEIVDKVLVWTMAAWAALGLTRPAVLALLEVDVDRLVHRQSDFSVAGLIIMTVLTVVLGLSLVFIAVEEALEIRFGARRSDPISGFLDQRTFERLSEASLVSARKLGMPASLAIVQFDWFAAVSDKWGSETCDAIIRQVSDIARTWQRDSDVLGRVGEDRIGIMLVGTGSRSGLKLLEKLHEALNHACNEDFGAHMRFTLSISIAESKIGMDFTKLFVLAALPLEGARSRGGNLTFIDGHESRNFELRPPEAGQISAHG